MPAEGLGGFLASAAQGLALILFAPFVVGFLRKLKAWLQLRRGPRLWQPYADLGKLWGKAPVRSPVSSWVFAAAPLTLFCTYALLAFTVPVFTPATLVRCDFLVIMYLLGFGRFVLALAGLDAGSPFAGMGSSREMFLTLLTETGLILFIVALMVQWETVSVAGVFGHHRAAFGDLYQLPPQLILLALALSLLTLFECERIPIEKQGTHLELTMAHSATTLEYAGRHLALLEWAEMIKLTFMLTLLGSLFIPSPRGATPFEGGGPEAAAWASLAYLAKTLLVLVPVLAVWELRRPKLRLRAITTTAFTAVVLSLLAIIYMIATKAELAGSAAGGR